MFDSDISGSSKTYLNGNELDPKTLGATQATPDTAVPELGEHMEEVLRNCGFSEDALAGLRDDGIG